jgi:excisionase family DNA binding protein
MDLLKVREIAAELRMGEEAVRRLLRRGSLKGSNPSGRRWLVERQEVYKYLNKQEQL